MTTVVVKEVAVEVRVSVSVSVSVTTVLVMVVDVTVVGGAVITGVVVVTRHASISKERDQVMMSARIIQTMTVMVDVDVAAVVVTVEVPNEYVSHDLGRVVSIGTDRW